MPHLDNLKKQAKQLVRWRRERNFSLGERVRAALPRYAALSDHEIVALKFPLSEAQEVIARECGYESWAALKAASQRGEPDEARAEAAGPEILDSQANLIVANVTRAADWFSKVLGFETVFLHGKPAFYGQVRRGSVSINLRHEDVPVYVGDIREREQLLAVSVHVRGVTALYAEFKAAGAAFYQGVKRQPWGGKDFIVRDPDGNLICFGTASGED